VCISYDIPKIETHGKKKLFRKGKLGRGRNRSLGRFLATGRYIAVPLRQAPAGELFSSRETQQDFAA
jgi:hypothetical protein